MKKTLGILVLLAGAISGILFFVAGFNLTAASTGLTELRSIGGTSVAEAYYQEAGKQGLAYATALYACGLAIISISLGLGGRLLSADSDDTSRSIVAPSQSDETHP